MFNLIITIIAIALVVVLTATSVFYGGSAFSEGSVDALAATYINQAQQVQGAATIFRAQTGGVVEVVDNGGNTDSDAPTELLGDYLTSVPVNGQGDPWTVAPLVTNGTNTHVVLATTIAADNDQGITAEVCQAINAAGQDLVGCVEGDITALDGALTAPGGIPAQTLTLNDAVLVGMAL